MAYRLLDGHFRYGDMYILPNRLFGVGAVVRMHSHKYDHLMETKAGKGDVRYRLRALVDDKPILRELGPDEFVYIKAGVGHSMELISGEEGGFVCIFSAYGPDGERRPEPAE